MADKGLGAAEFDPKEAAPLRAQGFDDQAIGQDPRKGLNSPAFTLMREVLGRDDFDAVTMLEGRKIYLQGRAAALENAATAEEEQRDQPDLMELADQIRRGKGPEVEAHRPRPTPQPVTPPPSPAPLYAKSEPHPPSFIEKEDGYNPATSALVQRLTAQKKRQGMSAQMIGQMTKFYDLFIEASTVAGFANSRTVITVNRGQGFQ